MTNKQAKLIKTLIAITCVPLILLWGFLYFFIYIPMKEDQTEAMKLRVEQNHIILVRLPFAFAPLL